MIEVIGNLWHYKADWRCITTNAVVNHAGDLVMGRGCAAEAKRRYPGLASTLARRVAEDGNHVHAVSALKLITFPVKDRWDRPAKPSLIYRSACELRDAIEAHDLGIVVLPRPGCGNGSLHWDNIRPLIESVLPDAVHVITFPERNPYP